MKESCWFVTPWLFFSPKCASVRLGFVFSFSFLSDGRPGLFLYKPLGLEEEEEVAYTQTVNLVLWKGATLRRANASVELFHWYNQRTTVGALISLSIGCLGAGKPAKTPFSAWALLGQLKHCWLLLRGARKELSSLFIGLRTCCSRIPQPKGRSF